KIQSSRGNILLVTAENETFSGGLHWEAFPLRGGRNLQYSEAVLSLPIQNSAIKQCYAQRTPDHCKLLYSKTICWTVIGVNLFKAILMLLVAYGSYEKPILTIGDAVASYLEDIDKTTTSMCLTSNLDFGRHGWSITPRKFTSQPLRKLSVNKPMRWKITGIPYVLLTLLCLYIFLVPYRTDFTTIIQLGLGATNPKTILNTSQMKRGSKSLVVNASLANTPQLLLSILYFNYNALYTGLCLVTEWDRFSNEAKGLRVSAKTQGAQRGTYFLQLPYRYSIPLLFMSGFLHWLVSQSIFLVNLEIYGPSMNNVMDMVPSMEESFTSCGWSPLGVLLSVITALLMFGFLLFSGWQKLRFCKMPVVGSCSAAISAACHPNSNESLAWEKPLQWGVVSRPGELPHHCSFSSRKVGRLEEGQMYA
ncbi:unnamed protein product, partial [Colletotrichum noveboracense]